MPYTEKPELKLEFINNYGWEEYITRGNTTFYTKEDMCIGGMCDSYNLDDAYAIELKEQYMLLRKLVKRAKLIIDSNTLAGELWNTEYNKL